MNSRPRPSFRMIIQRVFPPAATIAQARAQHHQGCEVGQGRMLGWANRTGGIDETTGEAKMTCRERLTNVFTGRPTDRTPITVFITDSDIETGRRMSF